MPSRALGLGHLESTPSVQWTGEPMSTQSPRASGSKCQSPQTPSWTSCLPQTCMVRGSSYSIPFAWEELLFLRNCHQWCPWVLDFSTLQFPQGTTYKNLVQDTFWLKKDVSMGLQEVVVLFLKLFHRVESFPNKKTVNEASKNLPESFSKLNHPGMWLPCWRPLTSLKKRRHSWNCQWNSGADQTHSAPYRTSLYRNRHWTMPGRTFHSMDGAAWPAVPSCCPLSTRCLSWIPHCHQCHFTDFYASRTHHMELPLWSN